MTLIFRVIDSSADGKSENLLEAVTQANGGIESSTDIYACEPENFSTVPGSPFSYWTTDAIRATFTRIPSFKQGYLATRGAYTTDDFRFYRLSWEVSDADIRGGSGSESTGHRYVNLAKGGSFADFYSDVHLVVRWQSSGAEAKAFLSSYRQKKGWGTDWSACLNGYSHYLRPGLTWSLRTQKGLNVRVMPAECILHTRVPQSSQRTTTSRRSCRF